MQHDMGIEAKHMIPVKYKAGDDADEARKMNLLLALMFGGVLLALYRSLHGKSGTGSKGTKSSGGSGSNPFGGGGGGGMGDLMNMNKSGAQIFGVDKKIRTRFKHVAGMENAKQEVLEFVDFLKNPEKLTRRSQETSTHLRFPL